MMKKSLIFLAFFGIVSTSQLNAQSLPIQIGLGAELAMPLGDESDVYSLIAGASANAKFTMLPILDLTGSIGYQQWMGKSLDGFSVPNTSYVPLLVGARYHILPKPIPIFVKFEMGPVFNTKSEPGVNATGLGLSPGVGLSFGKLDALIKYEVWRNNGHAVSFAAAKLVYYIF